MGDFHWFPAPVHTSDHLQMKVHVSSLCAICIRFVCAGRQRNGWCPSLLATSSSASVRAGSATLSLTGGLPFNVPHPTFLPVRSDGSMTLPLSLSLRLLVDQCRGPLPALHDWRLGGRPVQHRRGQQASPLPAGHGGLSQTDSHQAFQWVADCPHWTGE